MAFTESGACPKAGADAGWKRTTRSAAATARRPPTAPCTLDRSHHHGTKTRAAPDVPRWSSKKHGKQNPSATKSNTSPLWRGLKGPSAPSPIVIVNPFDGNIDEFLDRAVLDLTTALQNPFTTTPSRPSMTWTCWHWVEPSPTPTNQPRREQPCAQRSGCSSTRGWPSRWLERPPPPSRRSSKARLEPRPDLGGIGAHQPFSYDGERDHGRTVEPLMKMVDGYCPGRLQQKLQRSQQEELREAEREVGS